MRLQRWKPSRPDSGKDYMKRWRRMDSETGASVNNPNLLSRLLYGLQIKVYGGYAVLNIQGVVIVGDGGKRSIVDESWAVLKAFSTFIRKRRKNSIVPKMLGMLRPNLKSDISDVIFIRYFDEFILPTDESRRLKSPANECIEGGLASSELRNNESNITPKLSKHVPEKCLPCSGSGRAKKAGKGVNKVVARCGDVKLTLRQRLEK